MSNNHQSDDEDAIDWAAGKIIYPYPPAEPSAAEVAISAIRNRSDLLAFVLDSKLTRFLRPAELVELQTVARALGVAVEIPDMPNDSAVRWYIEDATKWRNTFENALAAICDKLKKDTKKDTSEKKFRELSEAAKRCAEEYHYYRSIGEKHSIRDIVRWYVAEKGGSASSIQKQITDYKLLKSATIKDTKRHQ